MEINEERKFTRLDNGDMRVDIETTGELGLPYEGKQIIIGKLEQHTKQLITRDKVPVLQSFMYNQVMSAKGQMEKLQEQLKRLDLVDEKLIPEKTFEALEKIRKNVTSKSVTKHLKNLDLYMSEVRRKKQFKRQVADIDKQLKQVEAHYNEITKLMK